MTPTPDEVRTLVERASFLLEPIDTVKLAANRQAEIANAIGAARVAIDALTALLAERTAIDAALVADKERLDWLETLELDVQGTELFAFADDGTRPVWHTRGPDPLRDIVPHRTLREAIDAARSTLTPERGQQEEG